MSKFREDPLHYQHRRPNPNKPSVTSDGHVWWARVIDLNGEYMSEISYTQPDALKDAYELAALVESQRHGTEATA